MKVLPLVAGVILIAQTVCAAERVFVIDPGHGGSAPSGTMENHTLSSPNNAQTPSGIPEKNLTLQLSLEIASALERIGRESGQPVRVILTRRSDQNPDFQERSKRCMEGGVVPEAIVSIHFNATDGHNARGSLGMVEAPERNPNDAADRALALRLSAASARAISGFLPDAKAREPITDHELHGGKGSNFFYQLRKIPALAKVPKCFLEVEFIDRVDVEKGLISRRAESFPKIAEAVAHELLGAGR